MKVDVVMHPVGMHCANPHLISTEFPDVLHQPDGNIIRGGFKTAFGIYPDNRLRIRRSQMYPITVELYFQSILCIDGLLFIFLPDLFEYLFSHSHPPLILFYFLK